MLKRCSGKDSVKRLLSRNKHVYYVQPFTCMKSGRNIRVWATSMIKMEVKVPHFNEAVPLFLFSWSNFIHTFFFSSHIWSCDLSHLGVVTQSDTSLYCCSGDKSRIACNNYRMQQIWVQHKKASGDVNSEALLPVCCLWEAAFCAGTDTQTACDSLRGKTNRRKTQYSNSFDSSLQILSCFPSFFAPLMSCLSVRHRGMCFRSNRTISRSKSRTFSSNNASAHLCLNKKSSLSSETATWKSEFMLLFSNKNTVLSCV